MEMKIALGADHAGYLLKDRIRQYVTECGHQVIDEGTNSSDSVDYPDFAVKVAEDVAAGRADRGILVCGSGIGMAITANKVPGIRAANIGSEYEAQMSREHNDLNVLTLGARVLDESDAKQIVQIWLEHPSPAAATPAVWRRSTRSNRPEHSAERLRPGHWLARTRRGSLLPGLDPLPTASLAGC